MSVPSNYAADAWVTSANPAPGRDEVISYPVRSGTQWTEAFTTRSDGGIGLNVYIAGGIGPNGEVLISGTTTGGGGGGSAIFVGPSVSPSASTVSVVPQTASIVMLLSESWRLGWSIFNNTTSQLSLYFGPATGTASFTMLPQSTYETEDLVFIGAVYGSWASDGAGQAVVTEFVGGVTGSTGTINLNITNLPATQSVALVSPLPLPVTGTVGVVGTASVLIEGSSGPLNVTGTVAVSSLPGVVQPSTSTKGVFPLQTSSADTLIAANSARIAFTIFNDSDKSYLVSFGAGASTASFDFVLGSQQFYESSYPSYVGIVTGIGAASGTGNIRVQELTP